MAGKLSRFLRLEKRRRESPEGRPSVSDRFGTARPLDPAPPGSAAEMATRLRADRRRSLESGVALDEGAAGSQPFLRCGGCEADNSRFAERCRVCGESLTTPEQRAYNQRLWEERRAEALRESEQLALVRKGREKEAPLLPVSEQQRIHGEQLAAQVARRESSRLSWMGGGSDDGRPRTSTGLRLLQKIPDPRVRLAVAGATAVVALALGAAAFGQLQAGNHFSITQILFLALLFLFVPPRRGRGLFSSND